MQNERDVKKKGSAKQELSEQKKVHYVNLDQDMDSFVIDGERFRQVDQSLGPFGPKAHIDATLQSNKVDKRFKSLWEVKPNKQNTDVKLAGAVAASLEHAERTEERTGPDGQPTRRFFTNVLNLPDIGGDKHTVTVTKVNERKWNRKILSLEIETWRRIWITFYWTDDSQKALINQLSDGVAKAFKEAYIDVAHVPAQAKLDWDHALASLVSSDDINEDFVKAMHGGAWPALQRKPFHLQVVLIKNCARATKKRLNFTVDMNKMSTASYEMDLGSGGLKIKLPANTMEFLMMPDFVNQLAKVRPNTQFFNTVVSLQYKTPGVTAIAPSAVNTTYVDPKSFLVKDEGLTNLLGAQNFDVEATVEVADLMVAGQNKGNKLVVETHELKNGGLVLKDAKSMLHILVHEIGHAVDLVPDSSPAYKHPTQYRDHGGTGPHCSSNAKLDKGVYVYGGSGKMCIMYHSVHDNAGPDFCVNCLKFLKFTKLRKDYLSQNRLGFGWIYSS